jgi:hypothetical protein
VAALAAALALGTAIPAPATQAPAAPQLWRVVTDAGEAPQRGVLHSREVRTDDFRLREFTAPGDRLRLSMEPGTNLEVELVRVTSDPLNGYVWSGRVVGEPASLVTLVLEPDGIAGTVSYPGADYEIRLLGNGRSTVLRQDPLAHQGDVEVLAGPPDPTRRQRPAQPAGRATESTWDVLFLFTKAAARELGSDRAMKAAIRVAVANWNTALEASNLPITVRAVKMRRVKYGPTGRSYGYALQALRDVTNRDDGEMDKVHKWRERFGADFVSLIAQDNDELCGLGWLPGENEGLDAGYSEWPFHLVASDCVSGRGGLTTAHEGGHNVGLRHNVEDSGNGDSGAWPYSYGYRVLGNARTVMSYSCGAPLTCFRIPLFSTPDVIHEGDPMGTAEHDNARSMDNDREVVAAFRPCKRRCR